MVMARASLVNSWPRRASVAAFLCLIDAHFEWPDTAPILGTRASPGQGMLRRPGPGPAALWHRHPIRSDTKSLARSLDGTDVANNSGGRRKLRAKRLLYPVLRRRAPSGSSRTSDQEAAVLL